MSGVWIARYMTYCHPYEEECDTREEAVSFLAWGQEAGTLAAVEIVGPDGTVALEGDELDQAMDKCLGL